MTSAWLVSEVAQLGHPHPSAATRLPPSPTRGEGNSESHQTPSPLVGEGQAAKRRGVRGNSRGLTKRQLLPTDTVAKARALRRDPTEAEKYLWRALREAFPKAKFRLQVPMGRYFADFCSHGAKLIIEVDGSQHALDEELDATRTRFLEGEGYRVVRFWNNEVLGNVEGVIANIATHIPSPLVGEGAPKGRMRGSRERSVAIATPPHPPTAFGSGPLPLPQGERE
jgi:very-short-patch-repair endonuclease